MMAELFRLSFDEETVQELVVTYEVWVSKLKSNNESYSLVVSCSTEHEFEKLRMALVHIEKHKRLKMTGWMWLSFTGDQQVLENKRE